MDIIKVFYDLETTGLETGKHSVHQIAGLVEVNDVVVEEFNFYTRPHPKAIYEPEALSTCKKTEEEIRLYPEMVEVYKKLIKVLSKYVDKYDPKSKAWLIGFNNRYFDDRFFSKWFLHNGDKFMGSYFYFGLDVQSLASQYLLTRRREMPSFKLKRVAMELGLVIDKSRLHDASYDVQLTRDIYRIVTGLEIEL